MSHPRLPQPDPRRLWTPDHDGARPLPPRLRAELARALPAELVPPPTFRAVRRRWAPSPTDDLEPGTDFVWCAPNLPDLGLPDVPIAEAVGLASKVPFLPAMRALSALAAALYHAHEDRERQLGLARVFYGKAFAPKVVEFVTGAPHRLAFDPRHIGALQRLLIMHARDEDPDEGLVAIEWEWLAGALLAVATALPHYEPPEPTDEADPDWAAWARYTTQLSLYYDAPWVAEAMARAWSNYVTVAADLADRPDSCPVDEWMVADFQIGLAAQVGAGLAYAVGSGALEPGLDLSNRAGRRPGPGYLKDTALAAAEPDVIKAISADRDELREMLIKGGESPLQVGWDHAAFEARPFLREPSGHLILISPWALVSWLTRGIHYRVLDAGADRPHPRRKGGTLSKRWLDHAGALGEESVRRLLDGSIPKARLLPTVLHGEELYDGPMGQQASPDAAVETWPDIALLEVYSGRFSRAARSADPELLLDAMQRGVIAKIREVRTQATTLLEGGWCYEAAAARPQQVFPMLVLAGDSVGISPMLWGWIRENVPELDDDPRIRRPIIVDLDDLEPLLALVERGESFIDLLKRFLSSELSEFPFRNWLHAEVQPEGDLRPRYVREQWRLAALAGAGELYPDSDRLAEQLSDH